MISVNIQSVENTRQFLKEAVLLKKLNHKNILCPEGIAKIDGRYTIILPYVANGNLLNYLKETPKQVIKGKWHVLGVWGGAIGML